MQILFFEKARYFEWIYSDSIEVQDNLSLLLQEENFSENVVANN